MIDRAETAPETRKGKRDDENVHQTGITIHASGVHDNKDGTFLIQLPMRRPTPQEAVVLARLYPTLGELAYGLLTKEALLAAIA